MKSTYISHNSVPDIAEFSNRCEYSKKSTNSNGVYKKCYISKNERAFDTTMMSFAIDIFLRMNLKQHQFFFLHLCCSLLL